MGSQRTSCLIRRQPRHHLTEIIDLTATHGAVAIAVPTRRISAKDGFAAAARACFGKFAAPARSGGTIFASRSYRWGVLGGLDGKAWKKGVANV